MAAPCPEVTAEGDIWLGLGKGITYGSLPQRQLITLTLGERSPWFQLSLQPYFWLKPGAVTQNPIPPLKPGCCQKLN